MSLVFAVRTPRWSRIAFIAFVAVLTIVVCAYQLLNTPAADPALFDAKTGYRVKNFRAPMNAPLIGGTVIKLDDLEKLIAEQKPVLIDVMLIEHGLKSILTFGYLGENPNRENIPGSVWMPMMGQASLSRDLEARYRHFLSQLTNGNMAEPIVFYCLSDCWASWNAARRAISFGYSNVLWFKEGTDLWRDAGLPVERAQLLTYETLKSREK